MKTNLNDILLIGCAVLLTLQINSCFTKVHKPESMIRNEERIKYLEEMRLADSVNHISELALKDSEIADLKERFAATTPRLQQAKKDYDKIRPVINALDNNELLQRANGFKPD